MSQATGHWAVVRAHVAGAVGFRGRHVTSACHFWLAKRRVRGLGLLSRHVRLLAVALALLGDSHSVLEGSCVWRAIVRGCIGATSRTLLPWVLALQVDFACGAGIVISTLSVSVLLFLGCLALLRCLGRAARGECSWLLHEATAGPTR